MNPHSEIEHAFGTLIEEAYAVSRDLGNELEAILSTGRDDPLRPEEACRLLDQAISLIKRSAQEKGDQKMLESLSSNLAGFVDRIVALRSAIEQSAAGPSADPSPARVVLVGRNGIEPRPVFPRPCFHGREVAMQSGWIRTTDIQLWERNERLDIHLGQFRKTKGRGPTSAELLDIMLSKMVLPGIQQNGDADQFAIVQLARSIAVNGVRKPPIIDVDGTLLDGNRRIAACNYVLNSDEFDTVQKRRAEYVFVWQLTEHATDDERNAVVVSLNFEPDCKQDWPEYVKAKKLFNEWESVLALEPRRPGPSRQAELKKELSMRFALGPDTRTVNRYLKMVEWAGEFEDFHIDNRRRDEFEVKHRANRYFQYFDELAKGTRAGGVAYALNQDEAFKHLVFDLLYEGKFRNWRQIRELKLIYDEPEAREALEKARTEDDLEVAEDHLENALAIARSRSAAMREVGANTRIESFVEWLEQLPVRAFRDHIKRANLERLLSALRLVEKQAAAVLKSDA